MDRVIFNEKGEYVDLITHQGAEGNDFVECQVTPDISSILEEIFKELNDKILDKIAQIIKDFTDSQSKIKSSINDFTSKNNNVGSGIAGAIEEIV